MELTDKMLEAGCEEYRSDFLSISKDKQEALKKTMRSVWAAMASAAVNPSPETAQEDPSTAPAAVPLTLELAKQLVEAYGDDDDNTDYVGHMLVALKSVFAGAYPSVPSMHVVQEALHERDVALARCKVLEEEREAIDTRSAGAEDYAGELEQELRVLRGACEEALKGEGGLGVQAAIQYAEEELVAPHGGFYMAKALRSIEKALASASARPLAEAKSVSAKELATELMLALNDLGAWSLTERSVVYLEKVAPRIAAKLGVQLASTGLHDWEETGGGVGPDGAVAFYRCKRCHMEQDIGGVPTIEGRRALLTPDGCVATPRRCPTCDSPSPRMHPAVQHEGEVQVCKDAWHTPIPTPAAAEPAEAKGGLLHAELAAVRETLAQHRQALLRALVGLRASVFDIGGSTYRSYHIDPLAVREAAETAIKLLPKAANATEEVAGA